MVERLRPANDASPFAGGTVADILLRLAQAILRAALTPDALALHRIIVAEASRFPELAATAAQFPHMVVAVPQRRALGLGTPMTEAERDAWARDTVRLFLDGAANFR